MKKRILALLLALAMVLSLAACGKATEDQMVDNDLQRDGQIGKGLEGVDVEVNEADEHLDSTEACNSGKCSSSVYMVIVCYISCTVILTEFFIENLL